MADFEERAKIMEALYANGAVDLERSGRTIGFERKATRADTRRSQAVGGQGTVIDAGYWLDEHAVWRITKG